MRSDALPRSGKLSPDTGMCASGKKLKRQRRKRSYHRLDEGLTAGTVLLSRAMHAMQQFRGRNRGNANLLVRAHLFRQSTARLGHGAVRWQTPDSALEINEDGGV